VDRLLQPPDRFDIFWSWWMRLACISKFEVSLLSTLNMVFSKILAMLIKFCTHYPDSPIQTLRMDNAKEFC
jgi:hypothetical protein